MWRQGSAVVRPEQLGAARGGEEKQSEGQCFDEVVVLGEVELVWHDAKGVANEEPDVARVIWVFFKDFTRSDFLTFSNHMAKSE